MGWGRLVGPMRLWRRAEPVKAPAEPVRVDVHIGAEPFTSALEAIRSANAQECAALRAEVAALRAALVAYHAHAESMTTRFNSLQGLVNRKLAGEKVEREASAPLVTPVLGWGP